MHTGKSFHITTPKYLKDIFWQIDKIRQDKIIYKAEMRQRQKAKMDFFQMTVASTFPHSYTHTCSKNGHHNQL